MFATTRVRRYQFRFVIRPFWAAAVAVSFSAAWAAAAQPVPFPLAAAPRTRPQPASEAPPVEPAVAPGTAVSNAEAAPGIPRISIIHKVRTASERLEMTVNTSRILTMDQKIPQAQVNNPELLDVVPLSPGEIQISAKKPGVTQVNLWGEDRRVYTIDVIVMGDAQALSHLLATQFPTAALKVVPVANGVLISGFVDRPEHIDLIVRIAEEFYPKVINAITVGGAQQVLLHVKVMEVSRTKLRRLGFDFANFSGGNSVVSGISGLITSAGAGSIATSGNQTFTFGVVDGASAFFGVLEALRQDDLAKILAEPTLVTVSGRPAQFTSGGEFPVPVPQSLGTISIEFKKFGTQLDFVPIVLGNGCVRLEVRPRVSEIDRSRSVTVAGTTVPGLRTREVETGVEMRAGQTLAIAGLVYERTEAQNRGLPLISEVPYLGTAFRKVNEETNTIELLIMVTPELVEPMNPGQVPPCGPGQHTMSPRDCDLYFKGHLEVPRPCPVGCPTEIGPAQPAEGESMPGMIGPGELVPSPPPEGTASGRAPVSVPLTAQRPSVFGGGPQNPQNRPIANQPHKPAYPQGNAPKTAEPGFIGPIGYDLVN